MFRSLRLVFIMILFVLGLVLPGAVPAEEQQKSQQTVTLQVENMTCSACPFTVKKVLKQVDGVKQVRAKYEGDGEGWVKVIFDPRKTNAKSLIKATTNAGYPSHL